MEVGASQRPHKSLGSVILLATFSAFSSPACNILFDVEEVKAPPSLCEDYCAEMARWCSDEYDSTTDCLATCELFPRGGTSGDTAECRLIAARESAAEPELRCGSAGAAGIPRCADGVEPCAGYCETLSQCGIEGSCPSCPPEDEIVCVRDASSCAEAQECVPVDDVCDAWCDRVFDCGDFTDRGACRTTCLSFSQQGLDTLDCRLELLAYTSNPSFVCAEASVDSGLCRDDCTGDCRTCANDCLTLGRCQVLASSGTDLADCIDECDRIGCQIPFPGCAGEEDFCLSSSPNVASRCDIFCGFAAVNCPDSFDSLARCRSFCEQLAVDANKPTRSYDCLLNGLVLARDDPAMCDDIGSAGYGCRPEPPATPCGRFCRTLTDCGAISDPAGEVMCQLGCLVEPVFDNTTQDCAEANCSIECLWQSCNGPGVDPNCPTDRPSCIPLETDGSGFCFFEGPNRRGETCGRESQGCGSGHWCALQPCVTTADCSEGTCRDNQCDFGTCQPVCFPYEDEPSCPEGSFCSVLGTAFGVCTPFTTSTALEPYAACGGRNLWCNHAAQCLPTAEDEGTCIPLCRPSINLGDSDCPAGFWCVEVQTEPVPIGLCTSADE